MLTAAFHFLGQDSSTSPAAMAPIDQLPPGVIVVSGASRGLGRELVEQLRHQGRPLIAVVRRFEGSGLAPEGEALQLVEANLATTAGIEIAIAGILAALGDRPLAALVNGAGTVCPICEPPIRPPSSRPASSAPISPTSSPRRWPWPSSAGCCCTPRSRPTVAKSPWYVYDATLQPQWLPEGTTFTFPEP